VRMDSKSLQDCRLRASPEDRPVVEGRVLGFRNGELTLSTGEGHLVTLAFTSHFQAFNLMLAAKLVGDAMEEADVEFHVHHGRKHG
jgi:hypothetical protein